jgi:hypothetical protein
MSESDQFRQYAEGTPLWVAQAKTEEKKQLLFELMYTWTAAAVATAAKHDLRPRSALNSPGAVPCQTAHTAAPPSA